ncbi:MAG: hypothetical protein M4D80_22635 [Myxococcota bacterium]|nr:hypothetical protein [Myxococcota bacterium]
MRLFIVLFLLSFACAAEAPDDPNEHIRSTVGGLDRHRLIEDADLEGDQSVTVAQIQALLVDQGSALATFSENNRTAAQWIVQESIAQHISPVYMVARIETESSLIRSGTLSKIRQATGCACPDGSACDPKFAAFGLQVRCAAELVRGYLADLDAKGSTITGWRVGVGRNTSDPCWVVPQNRATAALYTYTPWVGHYAAQCGTSQWGGSSLVALLVRHFGDLLPVDGGCPLGNGLYCGGNGIAGTAGTLYRCTNGALTVQSTCAAGCFIKPAGQDDVCVDTTQTCGAGNGLYCAGNGILGNAGTLYRCQNGTVSVAQVCTAGCLAQPTGQNDICK